MTEKIHKIALDMTTNYKELRLRNVIKYKKVRISYFNFTTHLAGGQKIYILFDNHNEHPVYSDGLPFDHYFKVLPLYSAPSQQFFYLNNQSFDVVFDEEREISAIKLYVLVNGQYDVSQISPDFPLNVELEFLL